jgi:hypothetical protein
MQIQAQNVISGTTRICSFKHQRNSSASPLGTFRPGPAPLWLPRAPERDLRPGNGETAISAWRGKS